MPRNPSIERQRGQPISAIALCGLILLYTLPAAFSVLAVVAGICLTAWWLMKRLAGRGSAGGRAFRFKTFAVSSLVCVIVIAALYDLALVMGPQNDIVAAFEADLARVPLLHFAERYRAGAALTGEPLPNMAGFCLSLIALAGLVTAAGFQGLDTDGFIFAAAPSNGERKAPSARLPVISGLAFLVFILNMILTLIDFATTRSYRAVVFKMDFAVGPFIWIVFTQMFVSYGILFIKNSELYHRRKAGGQ